MPNVSRASRAASVNGSVSWMITSTREPAMASISSRMLMMFDRVWTNGSGAVGEIYAWMKTGRSDGRSSIRARVSALSEWSCSAVTSSRTLARPTMTPTLTSAIAIAAARTAWCSQSG